MRRSASVWVQYLLPQRLLATLVYRLARCRWRAVKNPLIRWFKNRYSVSLEEAERTELASYESFNDFFTRRLKAGARPIAGSEHTLVSPVDGRLTQFGTARDGELIQAKGMSYRVDELLGEPRGGATSLVLGCYATMYLAPNQYHRVHLPLAGTLSRTRYIPGKRFSVNEKTTLAVPGLFCRNERVVCWFDTGTGPLAIVLVGALNVSSITTRWLGEIASGKPREWHDNGLPQRRYGRGDEIGQFNLGSTVIVMLPPGRVIWGEALTPGQTLRVGEALGELRSNQGPGR